MPVPPPIDTNEIVITASRAPELEADTPASVTIIDTTRIERLDEPLGLSLLRLVPSTAVSSSGPAGSLTDVRIRGAEANHTLLFIDGIKANDPATGDQPRFDLLNADIVSRIEVVRGPQSAVWGSDAIGGVVTVNGLPNSEGYIGSTEAGSAGFARAAGSVAISSERGSIAAAAGWQRATGIDSFGGGGDKDGYRNLAARIRGTLNVGSDVQLGAAAFTIDARSQFDGFNLDPPFQHMDTLDNTRNRLTAGRAWAQYGDDASSWFGRVSAAALGSSNRNYLADGQINRTSGTRRTIDAQVEHRFTLGALRNVFILAGEAEHETFKARDVIYFGATDQNQSRNHKSITAEWRGETSRITGDVAVRRDFFSDFQDATTVRVSLLTKLGGGFAVAGSYSEGLAQPTFFDLYGFFPGSFVGNPGLKPESSRGFEVSLRYRKGVFDAALTGYRQRLYDEIVNTYDPDTFASSTENGEGVSHRSGVEAELGWQLADKLRLSANYSYLHATQPELGFGQVKELRRPKNSGSIAVDGTIGKLTYGASIAYQGRHLDSRDSPPFDVVQLGSYWLAGARIAYAVRPGIEVFARAANAFNAQYEDVYGYRTEGRSLYAGIRLSSRR